MIKCDQPNVFDMIDRTYRDCNKPGEFVIFDQESQRELTFCQEHIGEHLHYCTKGGTITIRRVYNIDF